MAVSSTPEKAAWLAAWQARSWFGTRIAAITPFNASVSTGEACKIPGLPRNRSNIWMGTSPHFSRNAVRSCLQSRHRFPANAQTGGTRTAELRLTDPAFIHVKAQDRWVEAGGKLVPEELAKRAKHPFDMWDEMRANAAAGRFPKGTDIFLHKFHGLFYVAPNQDAFMLRLRLPGGIVSSHQAKGLSWVAERLGGGYLQVTPEPTCKSARSEPPARPKC